MSSQRRNFSAKFKSDLVIELLRGEKDLNTLAAENNIQPNLLRNWKKEFLDNASVVFDDKREENLNKKDLKKHKYDVFRLLQIVTAGTKVKSEGLVTESIRRYIEEISVVDESEVRLRQMRMPFDRDKGVELLREIYL